jgi:hypothetical protein
VSEPFRYVYAGDGETLTVRRCAGQVGVSIRDDHVGDGYATLIPVE